MLTVHLNGFTVYSRFTPPLQWIADINMVTHPRVRLESSFLIVKLNMESLDMLRSA